MTFSLKVNIGIEVQITNILGIKRLALQDKYLGVLLLIYRNKMKTLGHLEGNFHNKMATWKSKYINQATRTVMTQSVMGL